MLMLLPLFFSKILQIPSSEITGSHYKLTDFCSKGSFCRVKHLKPHQSPLRVVFDLFSLLNRNKSNAEE